LLIAQDPPDRFFWESLQYQYPELYGQDLPAVWLIGWGTPGKVGLVMEENTGTKIKIFDLVEDKILFLRTFEGHRGTDVWSRQRGLIEELVRRYGLSPSDRQPTVYPFLHRGRYYQILQRAKKGPLGRVIHNYDLVLKATGLGEKILGSFDGPWSWTYPLGILISPLEQRIAVFVLEYPLVRGRSAAPHWRIIGAHLRVGF
jgi:hypothetical protein